MSDRQFRIAIVLIALLVGFQMGYVYLDTTTASDPNCVNRTVQSYRIAETRGEQYNQIFNNTKDSVVSVRPLKKVNGSYVTVATGSGFVYDDEGHIVTNYHVVSKGERFDVTFVDGEVCEAGIVGADPYTDLAVLELTCDKKTRKMTLGNSKADVGDSVLAIGNPFGLSGSMTEGIVSQTGRLLPAVEGFSIPNVIQTDAAINPGNSGGPLLNIEGKVIGINTAINTRTSTFSGVGFAIPIETVKRVVPKLISEGSYEHPWIGVTGVDVTPPIAEAMGLKEARGFLVVDVVDDSPADKAGIIPGDRNVSIRGVNMTVSGDVIVGIGGREVRQLADVLNYLARETSVGDTISIEVLREGKVEEMELTLESRPEVE